MGKGHLDKAGQWADQLASREKQARLGDGDEQCHAQTAETLFRLGSNQFFIQGIAVNIDVLHVLFTAQLWR